MLMIAEAQPGDVALIMDSWLRSYYDQPRFAGVPRGVFFPGARALADEVMAKRPTVLTVRSAKHPIWVGSWLCYSADGPTFALHWAFTKKNFRRRGYFRALLGEALKRSPDAEELTYGWQTRDFEEKLKNMGFRYVAAGYRGEE